MKILLVTRRHGPLSKPHTERHAEREHRSKTDDDEPSETLGQSRLASKKGAHAIIRFAIVLYVPVARQLVRIKFKYGGGTAGLDLGRSLRTCGRTSEARAIKINIKVSMIWQTRD